MSKHIEIIKENFSPLLLIEDVKGSKPWNLGGLSLEFSGSRDNLAFFFKSMKLLIRF